MIQKYQDDKREHADCSAWAAMIGTPYRGGGGGVGVESGKVVIHFAEPTAWFGMTGDQAMDLAAVLMKHARSVGLTKPATIVL